MKHSVRNLVIANGASTGSVSVDLKQGNVVACAIYPSATPSSPVDIKIEDTQGDEIHPFITYKDFAPGNGNYLESRKPLSVGKHKTVEVIAKASGNLTSEVVFQVVFYIEDQKI